MKLAAIDYDGTLFVDGEVSARDLKAIEQWRARGNLFVIVTGRDYIMAAHEIERYSIPLDYLICNTGASIYDGSLKKLFSADLPDDAVKVVQKHPASANSRYFLYAVDETTYWDVRDADSWLATLDLPIPHIDPTSALNLKGLQQIALEYPSEEEAAECVAIYNRTLGPKYEAHQVGICADIVPAGVDKATALTRLKEMLSLDNLQIIPLGDSENDLPMVIKYHGYAMRAGVERLRVRAQGLCDSVAHMLSMHMG